MRVPSILRNECKGVTQRKTLDVQGGARHCVSMKRLVLAMILIAFPALAQSIRTGPETGRPLPRYESLRFAEVNLRRGAGEDYPIAWIYRLYGLPVQVFQEFRDWRHVRDHDGSTGWMHKTQLGTARTALVEGDVASLYEEPDAGTGVVARVEPGLILRLEECAVDWCAVEIKGYRGWIAKTGLWGVDAGEVFEDD